MDRGPNEVVALRFEPCPSSLMWGGCYTSVFIFIFKVAFLLLPCFRLLDAPDLAGDDGVLV